MKTDDICHAYSGKHSGITMRLLEEADGEPSTVLIEGSAASLRLLAELLLAVAEEKDNDGFSISPLGGGREHFTSSSSLGVYIHRRDD